MGIVVWGTAGRDTLFSITNPLFAEAAFKDLMAELRRTNNWLALVSDQLTLLTAYAANAEGIKELENPPKELRLFDEAQLRLTLAGIFNQIEKRREAVK